MTTEAFKDFVPIASALIASYFGNKHFGGNYGFGTTPLAIGALVGPYLGGYIRTATANYAAVIYCSAAFAALALIPSFTVKKPRRLRPEKTTGRIKP